MRYCISSMLIRINFNSMILRSNELKTRQKLKHFIKFACPSLLTRIEWWMSIKFDPFPPYCDPYWVDHSIEYVFFLSLLVPMAVSLYHYASNGHSSIWCSCRIWMNKIVRIFRCCIWCWIFEMRWRCILLNRMNLGHLWRIHIE